MLFPHFHFSSKENRLLGFVGAENPEPQETVEASKPDVEAQPEAPLKPDLVKGKADESVNKADTAQNKAEGKVGKMKAKIAKLRASVKVDNEKIKSLEDELAAGEGNDDQEDKGPNAPGEGVEDSQEKVNPNTAKLAKSLEGMKMRKENAAALAEGLVAIGEFIKTFKEAFGIDDKKKLDKPGAANKDKPEEGGDKAKDSKEGTKSSAESKETPISKVQNPKEEADKIGDVESQEVDFEKKIGDAGKALSAVLTGKDTAPEARDAAIKKVQDLNVQLKKVEGKVESKGELLKEQERRNEFIDSAWDKAVGANPDIEDGDRIASSIKLEGGDDIVITLNSDVPEGVIEGMKAAGLDVSVSGNSITFNNVPPNIFDEGGNEALDKTFKALASGMEKQEEEPEESQESADESVEESTESTEEAPDAMSEAQTTKIRKVLEANRQDVEEGYGKVEGEGIEKRDSARSVVDALNAEIDFLEANDASPDRNIDGKTVSLVDRLKEKKTNYAEKVKALSKDLPATKANPDDIKDNSEQYARKRVEEYRRTKEEAYTKDPSRKNAQLVIDAVDAELAYLKNTEQNPDRSGADGTKSLQDRLEKKKDDYRSKLESGSIENRNDVGPAELV